MFHEPMTMRSGNMRHITVHNFVWISLPYKAKSKNGNNNIEKRHEEKRLGHCEWLVWLKERLERKMFTICFASLVFSEA